MLQDSRKSRIRLYLAVSILSLFLPGLLFAAQAGHQAGKRRSAKIISTSRIRYRNLANRPSVIYGAEVKVLPEVATRVFLSNTDVNRFVCVNGPVKDIVYSREKGLVVKTSGKNAFLKYLITAEQDTGKKKYARVPTDIYVICGDDTVYTIIGVPKKIPAQTIMLTSKEDKLKKNLGLFKGMPVEERIVKLIRYAYKGDIPESFDVKRMNKRLSLFRDITVDLKETITVEGEGLRLKEYVLMLKDGSSRKAVPVQEKDFLLPALSTHPLAIALDHMTVARGKPIRLFIVERKEG